MFYLERTVAVMVLAVLPGAQLSTSQTRRRPVIEIRRQIALAEPTSVKVDLAPLHEEKETATRPIDAAVGTDGTHNSRLPANLPTGRWKIAWQSPLAPDFPPAAIYQLAQRILVEGSGMWQLFDSVGSRIAADREGPGRLTPDAARGLFYLPGMSYLEARSLADGTLKFQLPMAFDDTYKRPLLARSGNAFVIAGEEQPRFGSKGYTIPKTMVVEVKELAEPLVVGKGQFSKLVRAETLLVSAPKIVAALQADHIFFAVPNALLEAGVDLKIAGAYSGSFNPLLISVDEGGYAYIIVEAGGGKHLWVVKPGGARVVNLALGPDEPVPLAPPIVGYDHCIYLVNSFSAAAFDAGGRLLWRRTLESGIAGAGVTPDGHLLVAAGDTVLAIDHAGEAIELARLHEILRTPPFLAESGRLFVAGGQYLYCLTSGG